HLVSSPSKGQSNSGLSRQLHKSSKPGDAIRQMARSEGRSLLSAAETCDHPVMTRPEDLIYAVDERPPWLRLIFLGMQHAVLMSVYPVLIVIVFRHAGASHAETVSALSLGMVALAAS